MSLLSTRSVVSTVNPPGSKPGTSSYTQFYCLTGLYPHLASDLLAYQAQICKFSSRFKASACFVYDTAFHHNAASNVSVAWEKVNEQLYNDILKEETLPYCIHCHAYGHRTLGCPTRSKPPQPFHPSRASFTTSFSDTFGSPSTAPNLPSQPKHPQQAVICHDFDRWTCGHPDSQ